MNDIKGYVLSKIKKNVVSIFSPTLRWKVVGSFIVNKPFLSTLSKSIPDL